MEKYCDYCDQYVELTTQGRCPKCNKHEDDMIDPNDRLDVGMTDIESGII